MHTFSNNDMADEITMVRGLQQEAREVSDENWADWVKLNKDKIRLSGNDGYVPDQEEWIKRCESFLMCMGASMTMPQMMAQMMAPAAPQAEPQTEAPTEQQTIITRQQTDTINEAE